MSLTSVAQAASRYRAVAVQTASPGTILVMLYDGLFRFLDEARAAMIADDRARAGERIGKAHAILSEFAATLDRSKAPELCDNLEGIYVFCMSRLTEANLHRDPDRIADVVRILEPVRDAFKQAVMEQGKGR